jgi:hypothetical protein
VWAGSGEEMVSAVRAGGIESQQYGMRVHYR